MACEVRLDMRANSDDAFCANTILTTCVRIHFASFVTLMSSPLVFDAFFLFVAIGAACRSAFGAGFSCDVKMHN